MENKRDGKQVPGFTGTPHKDKVNASQPESCSRSEKINTALQKLQNLRTTKNTLESQRRAAQSHEEKMLIFKALVVVQKAIDAADKNYQESRREQYSPISYSAANSTSQDKTAPQQEGNDSAPKPAPTSQVENGAKPKNKFQPITPTTRVPSQQGAPITSTSGPAAPSLLNHNAAKSKKVFQPTIPTKRAKIQQETQLPQQQALVEQKPPENPFGGRGEGFYPSPGRGRGFDPSPGRGRRFDPTPGRDKGFDPSPGRSKGFDPSPGRGKGFDPSPGRGNGFDPSPGRGNGFDPSPGRGRGFDPSPGRGRGFDRFDLSSGRGTGMGRGHRNIIQSTGTLFGQGASESYGGSKKNKTSSTKILTEPKPESVDIKEETIKLLHNLIANIPGEFEQLEPTPGGIKTKLLPHQKSALKWMVSQENSGLKGGIVGDEPGLGKTLSMITLIAEQKFARQKNQSQPGPAQQSDDLLVRRAPTTLVICPASVLYHWSDEIERHCEQEFLRVLVFHGDGRHKYSSILHQYDVVITTFDILRGEIPELGIEEGGEKNAIRDFDLITERRLIEQSALLKMEFERVVLDEGHEIKTPETQLSQAVCRIRALYRWVITATPIHNSPDDMYALMRFLRMHPFDDIKTWNAWFGQYKDNIGADDAKIRMQLLLRPLLLRRTKDSKDANGDVLVPLPEKTIKDVKIFLMEDEREIYDEVFNSQLEEFWDNTSNTEQKGQGLVRQLKLRQLACHPDLPNWEPKTVEGATGGPSITFNSGKMQYVMTQIPPILKAGQSCILVSQWTSHLDIYEIMCEHKGWKTLKLVGEVLPGARQAIVRSFNKVKKEDKEGDKEEDGPKILLLSLGAGAVGLNLIGGNHLFLLDLHYNPQKEAQAFDRIHRVGQEKQVFIHRLCAVNTFEEDVLRKQKEKLDMASEILDGSDDWEDVPLDFLQKVFHPSKMRPLKKNKL